MQWNELGDPWSHPDFIYGLANRWNAHSFPTKEAAEEFASKIVTREKRVKSQDDYGTAWVVGIGPRPDLFVANLQPRTSEYQSPWVSYKKPETKP
jgi:hypothetical protein